MSGCMHSGVRGYLQAIWSTNRTKGLYGKLVFYITFVEHKHVNSKSFILVEASHSISPRITFL